MLNAQSRIAVFAVIFNSLIILFFLWGREPTECAQTNCVSSRELDQWKDDLKAILTIKEKENSISQIHGKLDSIQQKLGDGVASSTMNQKVEALKKERDEFRRLYANLWCLDHEIFPHGGFCMKKGAGEAADVGGNAQWCNATAEKLAVLFAGSTVGDFGAGQGHYTTYLRSRGIETTAYDGAMNAEWATNDLVHYLDLSQPQPDIPIFDWILSLEVAEHIPPDLESVFISNLHEHNRKGIVLSWSLPNQGGFNHVNERPNEYVKRLFASLGYKNDLALEEKLRRSATLWWFQNTLMVFRKQSSSV